MIETKIAFLIDDLQVPGEVGTVVQHARHMSESGKWDVTFVLLRASTTVIRAYEQLPGVHVRSREEALVEHYDVVVATWWETVFTLFEIPADRYAYFIQSLPEYLYPDNPAERSCADLTLDVPVAFIVNARSIVEVLTDLRPDAKCFLVRNGIDKDMFAPLEAVTPSVSAPLRVLVVGSTGKWFDHLQDAIAATTAMCEPHHVTVVCDDQSALGDVAADDIVGSLSHWEMARVYDGADVVLNLSSGDGIFETPLQAFHRGVTCVVTPAMGYEEYVEHGVNGLVADWNDVRGTARLLDLLARDRALLHLLRSGALATARTWPSWEQSSQFMASALLAIGREPPPNWSGATARILAHLRAEKMGHSLLRASPSDER